MASEAIAFHCMIAYLLQSVFGLITGWLKFDFRCTILAANDGCVSIGCTVMVWNAVVPLIHAEFPPSSPYCMTSSDCNVHSGQQCFQLLQGCLVGRCLCSLDYHRLDNRGNCVRCELISPIYTKQLFMHANLYTIINTVNLHRIIGMLVRTNVAIISRVNNVTIVTQHVLISDWFTLLRMKL